MKLRIVSLVALSVMTLSLAAPSPSRAADIHVLVCYPGGPGSTDEAAPRLSTLFKAVESLAGWAPGRIDAAYHNSLDACRLYLKEQRPQLAILSLPMFLARGAELKVEALLQVAPVGGGEGRYHVIVEGDPATSLKELQGKIVAGDSLGEARFLSRVVFKGLVDVSKDVQAKRTRTALRAIKLVHRGKAAAAVLDEKTYDELKTLPFGAALREVFVSDPLPGWPVVALGDSAPGDRLAAADRKALLSALTKVCLGGGAKAVCEPVRLGGFEPVDADTYRAVRALFGAGDVD